MTGNVWEWVTLDNDEGGVLRVVGILSAGLGRCRSRAFLSESATIATDTGTRCCQMRLNNGFVNRGGMVKRLCLARISYNVFPSFVIWFWHLRLFECSSDQKALEWSQGSIVEQAIIVE